MSPTTNRVGRRQGDGPRRQPDLAGRRPPPVRALLDMYEDPADVYRIVFPPHPRVR